MTGSADTEAYEFQQIYGLEVVVIPTNRPMVRKDHPDLVFLNRQAKFKAVLEDIQDCHQRGQPVLVGTTSIETRSEEHTSELQSLMRISYAVFCLKKKKQTNTPYINTSKYYPNVSNKQHKTTT